MNITDSVIDQRQLQLNSALNFFKADTFPTIHPVHWLTSHFAVGGWSSLQRLSGMLTAHMTSIAPHNGFTWHPHRGLEIYTYVTDGEVTHEDTTGSKGVIKAGEVQRMFSGNYIEHQELNLSDQEARVIQIWFIAQPQYMGMDPHYEQVKLVDMPPRNHGDAVVRDIIGPHGATDSHVDARLTATVLPAGGQVNIELPAAGEDLFLYFVQGEGHIQAADLDQQIDLYDVLVATPAAEPATISAGHQSLTYLSFYLPTFVPQAMTY
jgi:redox-sensitive bicupin YhaK (pirin superfamily)